MSAEASTAVSSLKRLQAIALPAAFVGAILLGIGFQMDVDPGKKIFWSSYLYGFMVWFSLAIGSTTLIFLHHTIRAQWSLSILRVAEACAKTLPLLAVFFLPAVMPRHRIALLLLPFIVLLWPKTAEWQLHLIDVGQGTAVLLQKGDRGLLYDVGPVYGSFNATEAYVLPYLHYQGIRQLDYLVLSHADTDHTGAFTEVLKAYPKLQLIASGA